MRFLEEADEIRDALRLRSRAYAAQGFRLSDETDEYRDRHDTLPTTALLGSFDGDRLVAAMRLCFSLSGDDVSTLPCAAYYPDVATLKQVSPGGLVEVSRLSMEPEIANTSYRTTLYGFMVRSAFAAARAAEVSSVLIATKPEWVAYYKHLLGFTEIGEPALYPPGGIPITLLAGALVQASQLAVVRNRFFRITDEEIASMRRALAPILSAPAAAVSHGRRG